MEKIAQSRSFGLHVPNTVPSQEDLAQLAGPWSPAKLETIGRLLDIRTFVKLLIIHGRSTDWRALKNYLHDKLKLPEPVVMAEVSGDTRTLPEKFEQIALPVHAAIAVITPDDVGEAVLSGSGQSLAEPDLSLPRARQNVWVEIGWFWGALGRHRILLLRRGEVEIPSDLIGIEGERYNNDPGEECATKIQDFLTSIATIK